MKFCLSRGEPKTSNLRDVLGSIPVVVFIYKSHFLCTDTNFDFRYNLDIANYNNRSPLCTEVGSNLQNPSISRHSDNKSIIWSRFCISGVPSQKWIPSLR